MFQSPVIAVTFAFSETRGFDLWHLMFQGIVASGGTPVAVDCSQPQPELSELVRRCDGLVIGGGGDVDPRLYGGDPDDDVLSGVNPARDANEKAALAAARDHAKPVLAICRGAQLVNVALGGTLYADIARDARTTVPHKESNEALARTLHAVDVAPDTLLARWLGQSGRVLVNSEHHQGIRELAPPLRAVARSDDGLVEAFELTGERVLGVQWHPEFLWPAESHARLLLRNFVWDSTSHVHAADEGGSEDREATGGTGDSPSALDVVPG